MLVIRTRTLFRRGLNRGYETFAEELVGLRGRVRLDRMLKETTQLRGTIICDYDELTHDILHNQLLKATLKNLASCLDVEKGVRQDLRSLVRRFYDVADIRLSASHFRQISALRTNREYIVLMRLCEFIFWSPLPDKAGIGMRFQQVLEDEQRMHVIFEDFLRNFYRMHRTEYRVRAESLEWYVTDATEDDLAFLPRMITDITLRHPDHTIVIDAKFYKEALVAGPYGKKVQSQHLYQLSTYLQHVRVHHMGKGLSGMLIYPQVDRSLRLRYRLLGIPILVATVDLSQEWPKIETELHDVLNDCAGVACLGSNWDADVSASIQ